MFSLDERPALPETPAFGTSMEEFLVSVARREARPWRPRRRASIAVAASGAAAAIAIGAAVASNGSSPTRSVVVGQVHVHLADFSVDTNPGGTVTVTLSDAQILNPDSLRLALARAGIRAMITPDSFCYNTVSNRTGLLQAITLHQPGPGEASAILITPSKLPARSTLAIGYAHPPAGGPGKPYFDLLIAGAPVICSSTPPHVSKDPIPAPGDSAKRPPAG